MGKRFIAVASRRFITHHNSAVSLLALTAMAKTREEGAPILEQRERTKESRISAARMREVLGPAVADRL
jgi:hypothetical protein